MSAELGPVDRIRLYMELSERQGAYSMGEILFDPGFRSREWPRTAYSLNLDDMKQVFAELDQLRDVLRGFARENEELRKKLGGRMAPKGMSCDPEEGEL